MTSLRGADSRPCSMQFTTMNHLIMIVDDNPSNLKLMEALLGTQGYEVTSAMDAEQALAKLETEKPQLILMDIQLPGMDGLELTRRLKREARYSDIKILALTAYAMKGDEERVLAAGCDGYVAKPIDTRALPSLIASHLKSATDPTAAHTTPAPGSVRTTLGKHRGRG